MLMERDRRQFGHAGGSRAAKLASVAKKYTLDGATKAFNAFLKSLIRLGVPAGNTVVLTVPGRKTGEPRSTPITLQVEGGHRYALAPYGEVAWVQNVRAAGGRARLKGRGGEQTVRLQEVKPAEAAPLLKKYMESFGRVQPYFEAKPGDPVERFAAEAEKHPVFEVVPG
jgi:deazaflavin-dependent oxidoreductase (nitroreductase family)